MAARFGHLVYAQITHDGDLLLTLRTRAVSARGKQRENAASAHGTDDHLLKVSVSKVKTSSSILLDDDGDQYLSIDQDSVVYQLNFPDQLVCRPAISQSEMYFLQSEPTRSYECRPHFVKASISDGSTHFSVPVPQIAEAGRIYNNGKQVRATGEGEIQSSTPGFRIWVQDRDISLLLTNDQRFCIWSDIEFRVYIFCTGSGSLLYTQDRKWGELSWIHPNHSGFWLTQRDPFNTDRYTIEWPYCCWKMDSDSPPVGEPFFSDGLCNILDAAQVPVDLRVHRGLNWDRNTAGELHAWESQKIDPFCTMSISPLKIKEYDAVDLPLWMRELVLPNLDPSFLESGKSFGILQKLPPYQVTLPSRDSRATERRLLEFDRELSPSEEVYGTQAGYLTCWMPLDNHLLIVDFWPNW